MAPASSFVLSLAISALATLSAAAPTVEAGKACDAIKAALPGKLNVPGEAAYVKENKDYYNSGLAELGPACIAFPSSAEEVSTLVKLLNEHKTVPFAVKSGGHSPNPGHASVKDGVLIALRKLTGTTLDKEKKLAYVKPGGHFWDVYKALEGTGHQVVGARLGVVGIGGYLLQGGLSFLTGQYGMAGDVSIHTLDFDTLSQI
jgi:FAD/FMN-containing dehydrogenase